MNLLIFLLTFSFSILVNSQQKLFWYIQPCRITTLVDGTFQLCQLKSICASENTGTTVECSQYTYVTISTTYDCAIDCCPDISPVPTGFTLDVIQTCYNQAKIRQTLYVIKIVFAVCGCVGLVIGAVIFYLRAFVTNPYTGKKVYVGCLCCKKPADFQRDRHQQMASNQVLQKQKQANIMELNQTKLNKIQI